ncbi:MAG TPA: hypothetical protein VF525_09615 [Pyrinomonadaceae bacterium]|jgi:hypothetical protein
MISQEDFDKFVESYNTDFQYLLSRAAGGSYDCLITSFRVLKDLHDVIIKLHETTHLNFKVVPYPLTFRASDAFLTSLGFSSQQIANIYGFLAHVKRTQGREFEDCIDSADPVKCAVAGIPHGSS